jgi:Ca2+-binding RTX toxin-like protein
LTGGDVVAGGAGNDTITLVDNVNATAFAGANVTSVETVNALFSATAATLNVSANAGVTQVNVGNSIITSAVGNNAGGATVTLAKAQKAGINGTITNDNVTNNAAVISTVTFAFSDVAGGADAATLALNGASFVKNAANVLGVTSGVTIAGVETLTIEATGKNTIGVLTATETATLNVSGAGSLSATAAGGTFKVVDASTNTGGVTLNIAALAAADLKVTGGTGNDEITIAYGNLTKLDVINLGAGTDTLGFATNNVDFTTAAFAGALAGVTNVEGLKANGAIEFAADATLLTQSNFIINSTGKATLTGFANTDTLTFGGVAAAASTLGLELGQNTVSLTLAGTATAASDITNGLTVTGSSVVNLVSSGTSGVVNNVLAITTADNNAFNVTGSQNLTLTVTGSGGVTGQTVNAAAFTGKLTVTGTALADIITGGTGADTITGGAGADKMTGGAGADTFVFNAANGQTQSGAVFGSFDTITDFVVGTDKLQFTNQTDAVSGQQAAVQAAITALAAGSSATAIANAMAGANTTDLGVSFAVFGGDTYVLFEASGAGAGVVANDVFIKLTGVTTAPTFAADVVA